MMEVEQLVEQQEIPIPSIRFQVLMQETIIVVFQIPVHQTQPAAQLY